MISPLSLLLDTIYCASTKRQVVALARASTPMQATKTIEISYLHRRLCRYDVIEENPPLYYIPSHNHSSGRLTATPSAPERSTSCTCCAVDIRPDAMKGNGNNIDKVGTI